MDDAQFMTSGDVAEFGRGHYEKEAAAELLDRLLRGLATREAFLRLRIAAGCATLCERKSYECLGFARLGDYARERFGVSAREVRSLATVGRRTARLPLLRTAFAEGRIGWTKLRLLTPKAAPETEAELLRIAEQMTTRELEAYLADLPPSLAPTVSGIDCEPTSAADISDECEAVIRIRCPAAVRAQWRRVCELASRVAGSELAPWQAAEVVAAEAMSAAQPSYAGRLRSHAVVYDDETADPPGRRRTKPATEHCGILEQLRADLSLTMRLPEPRTAEVESVRALAASERLDVFALDAALRNCFQSLQSLDYQTGRLLGVFFDLRLYRELGYQTSAAYVGERLGVSASKARALVAIDRKLLNAERELDDAYKQGRLSSLRVAALLRIADKQNTRQWLDYAETVTYQRLVFDVETARVAAGLVPALAPLTPAKLDEAECQMRAQAGSEALLPRTAIRDTEIVIRGPISVIELFEDAIAAFGGATHSAPVEPVWRMLTRMLVTVECYWNSLSGHRDPVFSRDDWRCTVPACTGRSNLHDHHVVFRSQGGSNRAENRTAVCAWHHLRGIHEGVVRVTGTAPAALLWELGCASRRGPLMRLRGDHYLPTSAMSPAARSSSLAA